MKDSTIKIYIGYDSRHPIASEVCEYSLRKHSKDLDIEHLKLSEVDKNLYWREYKDQSTEFTYTRFLVPYLQDYEGWALFCDNDFLFLDDVKKHKPKALHFTEGGPWIVDSDYKNLWLDYKKQKENLR